MTGKRNCLPNYFLIILGFSIFLGTIIIVSLLYFIVTGYPTENIEQIAELCSPQPLDENGGKFDEARNEKMWFLENETENPNQSPQDWSDESTTNVLDTTTIPENDPIALAEKYRGIKNAPVMLMEPPITYINGKFRKFWVLNVDDNNYRSIDAELAYQTPHVYFWIEEGINYDSSDVKNLVDAFENQIYQRNREIFGKEWSPGIDNDIHLTILYAQELGDSAVYFSSADSLMPEIERF